MDFEDIRIETADAVAWAIIDRKDGRNALRAQTLHELCAALDQLAGDDAVRALVLTGEGKHFSAGADFTFLEELTHTPLIEIKDHIYSAFQGAARRLYRFPKPTIAAVHGAAITVGCELALACDFRLVSSTGMFQEAWIKLGVMPPLGGLFLLPRLVGLARAMEIALQGRAIGAEEAVRIGLASEALDDADALRARAAGLAADLAAAAPLAYRAAKEALQRGLETTMDAEWSANVNAQSLLLGTQDFREGLSAAIQRRPPRFTGH